MSTTIQAPSNAPAHGSGAGAVAVAGGSHPLIDHAALLDHFDGDADLLREITETFLEHCPELMNEIGRAAAARNAEGLRCAAHSLKGSVANFGAQDVVDVAFQLEQMGIANHLGDVDAAYAQLVAQMQALQNELSKLVNPH